LSLGLYGVRFHNGTTDFMPASSVGAVERYCEGRWGIRPVQIARIYSLNDWMKGFEHDASKHYGPGDFESTTDICRAICSQGPTGR